MNSLLQINNLTVSIEDLQVVNNLSLSVEPGNTHALMGPNGSGKSSLALTLMGHPRYHVTSGSLFFNSKNICDLTPNERAKLGIFLAFQHPCELPGVSVFSFLKEAHQAVTGNQSNIEHFRDILYEAMKLLGIDHAFVFRSVNEGFSGGEKKRLELLQLLVLKPQLAILDEIDSGLDVDALTTVAQGIAHVRQENPSMSILLITHHHNILQHLHPDVVHVFCNGTIVHSGNHSVALEVEQHGYNKFL